VSEQSDWTAGSAAARQTIARAFLRWPRLSPRYDEVRTRVVFDDLHEVVAETFCGTLHAVGVAGTISPTSYTFVVIVPSDGSTQPRGGMTLTGNSREKTWRAQWEGSCTGGVAGPAMNW
jgi:hypothetical protein